jgi:hypothetical protein
MGIGMAYNIQAIGVMKDCFKIFLHTLYYHIIVRRETIYLCPPYLLLYSTSRRQPECVCQGDGVIGFQNPRRFRMSAAWQETAVQVLHCS